MIAIQNGIPFKRLKDVFYETRVLMGRGFTLQRFATDALDAAVDPVMLSYIEKGKRFAPESLVHKLAKVRNQDPQELLVLLWQDRMIYAFSRELRKVIKVEKSSRKDGLSDAEIAFLISRGIAALPEDGSFITMTRWERSLQQALEEVQKSPSVDLIKIVFDTLREQGFIERQKEKVKRLEKPYIPNDNETRRSLALEYCDIFTKSVLEKIILKDKETYLQNHYLHIPHERIGAFYDQLDHEVKKVVHEFATDEKKGGKEFVNVLIASTPF